MPRKEREELLANLERWTELPLLVLALALIPLLVIPFVVSLPEEIEQAFLALDWFIWAVFALDLGAKTYLASSRLRYLRGHWFDVIIVVVPVLRPLRALRVVRALRGARAFRLIPLLRAVAAAARSFTSLRNVLGMRPVLGVAVALVLACAGVMTVVERGADGSTIQSFGDALWWAVSTVSTVGYGDAVPTTMAGRGIAYVLILLGIALFSLVTANLASFFIEREQRLEGDKLDEVLRRLERLEAALQGRSSDASPI
jgi:voltage-gated potassium channel